MTSWDALSHSEEETIQKGRELAAQLRPLVYPEPSPGVGGREVEPSTAAGRRGALVLLSGELGAGKTTFTKGIISGLGVAREEDVTSPTFTLVHTFALTKDDSSSSPYTLHPTPYTLRVYHVDLYRVADLHDLETLGLEDVFSEPAIVIVEWPERLTLGTEWPRIEVRLQHVDEHTRRIEVLDPAGVLAA